MFGDGGVELPFAFVPYLQTHWFANIDITYSKRGIWHPAGAILPWEEQGWYQKVFVAVFYACSEITAGIAQTSISGTTAQTVLNTGTGQTNVKGEPLGGPCE